MQNKFPKRIIDYNSDEMEELISSCIERKFNSFMLNNNHPDKGYLDVKQAAEFLHCSVSKIYFLTSKRLIPHIKSGKKLLFVMKDIDAWLKEKNVLPAAANMVRGFKSKTYVRQ